ncbi:hypothetical protein RI578_39280 [Streptomyces sp. BB1-1-1]|uniref:hypothetical protein n=1 Tax=Streptomyces sp. BB1-1-1 TaxID=3074430 RepID=UPI002877D951|nr:hypothetical protein [Streptomyces sp. BB1-1-1]WND39953.1 hypothetical protein RI578_39280 [Streptomyces sp. BB1-1-1]
MTDRLRLRHGYAEEGLILPSRLPAARQADVIVCADRAIRAVGLTSGAVHTEVALTARGPAVIEVNARAGGPVPDLLRTAADYDYAAQIGRAALRLPPTQDVVLRRAAWHRFMPIPEGEWRVASQEEAAKVRERFPELVYLSPRFRPGQQVSRAPHPPSGQLHAAGRDAGRGTRAGRGRRAGAGRAPGAGDASGRRASRVSTPPMPPPRNTDQEQT